MHRARKKQGSARVDHFDAGVSTAMSQQQTNESARERAQRFAAQHARPASPAPDEGQILKAIDRTDGTQLRVSLHLYQEKPYLRIAPWQRGENGSWWPVKGKGVTIKVREVADVTEGFCAAMDAIDRTAQR